MCYQNLAFQQNMKFAETTAALHVTCKNVSEFRTHPPTFPWAPTDGQICFNLPSCSVFLGKYTQVMTYFNYITFLNYPGTKLDCYAALEMVSTPLCSACIFPSQLIVLHMLVFPNFFKITSYIHTCKKKEKKEIHAFAFFPLQV